MEEIRNCVYCHNECDLRDPKCGKGEKMAQEIKDGTWKGPEEPGGRKEGRHPHGEDRHKEHGGHGGHRHGHHHHEEEKPRQV